MKKNNNYSDDKKDEETIKLSLFQDFIIKKIIFDLKKKNKPYLEKQFDELKQTFDFENEYSEKILNKFYKKNPIAASDYFNNLKKYELTYEEATYKANDFIFIPDGVYCFEIYDSADDKQLITLFQRLEEMGSSEEDYERCKEKLRECRKKIQERKYSRSDKSFIDFFIPIDSSYFDKIFISFALFSNNLFRLNYYFRFKDEHCYLLRNYFTYGVKSILKVTRKKFSLTYNINYTRADKRITSIYSAFEDGYYKDIKNFIGNNFKGVLYNLLNDLPCTIRYFFDHPRYFVKKCGVLLLIDYEETSAFKYLLDCKQLNKDRYIEANHGSAFIPIEPKKNDYSDMIMIHACRFGEKLPVYSQTIDLSWLSIIDYLFFKQYEAGKNISRFYNSFDINKGKKKTNFTEDKKTINIIEAFINMFENELKFQKRMNKKNSFKLVSNDYLIEVTSKLKINYLNEYLLRIKNRKKTLKDMIKQLNKIHQDRFQEKNINFNTHLQIVIAILSVVTVILTIITLCLSISQKKIEEQFKDVVKDSPIENTFPEETIENPIIDYTDLEEKIDPEELPLINSQ